MRCARNLEDGAELARSLARYEARLGEEQLRESDLALGETRAWRALARSLPLGVPGALFNFVPYRVTGWITRRFARTPEEPATYMLLTALLVFP